MSSDDNDNSLEAVAVSYSEEQFDPPSSSKRRRVDETNSLAADNDQVVRADEESGGGEEDERQRIHRPTRRSYNDALLLASLSNDEQVDEKEEPASSSSVNVNALPSGDSEDNAISIAAGTHNTDVAANASSVDTPRRSNAISGRTSLQDVPSDKSRGGFILHPKPSSQDTPENDKSTAKKVTPDRMDARPSAASHHVMNNNPYPPPVRYPYYPPYGHHVYHPPPYYPTHHRYPTQPPPPSIGTTIQSSPSAEAPPLMEKSRESSSSQSHSPLPYHPLSHVPPPPPPHHYEDHACGYYDQSRYHGGGGYYPPPPPHHHHQPASYGSYPPPPTAVMQQQQPTNNPTPTSTYPPSSSSHPTNTSTSPSRSVKPWVSMDENSPRIMYQPSKSEDPSGQAPGTPIDEYHPSTTTHPPSYDYYGYNNPPPYGRSQEYSTPPAAYHASSPSWDGSGGAMVPKTTFSPQLHGQTPHGVPPPPTTPMCTDGTNAKKHQFRKGMRGMHSDPVILRKKFSWRNYPELEEYLIANRTEYLRHSALNYTAEQKHFNNRLTEGLLELAARHNYIFDETCFNFVAVRDRIRCYYKSYVQSSKKRGIIVGFPKSGVDNGKKLETVE
eukprot:scaffold7775_cov61-Cyclotella_meneghiniana.AAC.22